MTTLVSSIRALSMSLFPDNGINIFIEQTRRVIHLPGSLTAPQTGTGTQIASLAKHAAALPILEDDTVSVIVNTFNGAAQDRSPPGSPPTQLRLLADLSTLLTGVIIYPGASIRFVELVSQIVQRTTNAFVSRACQPLDHHVERALPTPQRNTPPAT